MKRETVIAAGAALVSGVLLGCSYPPVGVGFAAWVALVPLLWWMEGKRPGSIFWWVFLSGIVFHLFTVSWMSHITWVGMLCAVIALSVFYTIPIWITGLTWSRWRRFGVFLLPFTVAGVEWARSFDVLAFPWMILGNSQTSYPWLIQYADITSAFGVSWWVALMNVAVYRFLKRRTVRRFAVLGMLIVLPLGYSAAVITHPLPSEGALRVALIQGNVLPGEKWGPGRELWNINLYRDLTIDTMASEPDFIIWPETATPVYLCEDYRYLNMVQSLVDSLGVPLLTGTPAFDYTSDKKWNAACLIEPSGRDIQRYEKIHLVPFGEAFPLDELFPSLRNIELGQANWDEGEDFVVFEPRTLSPFNVAICFESIFPDLIREFITRGSEFIVVITNDVWFGPVSAPIQHAMISVFRAIEFHRPVVRCANTGISMVIDRYGRIKSRTGTFERATLVDTIEPSSRLTFYARYGNLFSGMCLVVTLLALVFSLVFRRKPPEAG
ncbi:apolipoprotein N-acyltransferase [Candidatus Latescibacterota bacterium]